MPNEQRKLTSPDQSNPSPGGNASTRNTQNAINPTYGDLCGALSIDIGVDPTKKDPIDHCSVLNNVKKMLMLHVQQREIFAQRITRGDLLEAFYLAKK